MGSVPERQISGYCSRYQARSNEPEPSISSQSAFSRANGTRGRSLGLISLDRGTYAPGILWVLSPAQEGHSSGDQNADNLAPSFATSALRTPVSAIRQSGW